MGVWHFEFADLGTMTRKLASTLLAAVPESDYETALKWFEKAEQVQPDFYIDNTFMIGKCYAKDCSLFESKLKLIRQREKKFSNFFRIMFHLDVPSPDSQESITLNLFSKFDREHAF